MINMIHSLKYKVAFLFVLGISSFGYSALEGGDPPPPEGDGSPASPVDMYLIYLAIVAIFVIFYAYKKSIKLAEK
jgi:hypothetical protein